MNGGELSGSDLAHGDAAMRLRLPYRAGIFGTFAGDMLREVHALTLTDWYGITRQPLRHLNTEDDGDITMALIHAWACVGDILTFYQERIANEGFLRTAEERLSFVELLRSIDYELRPTVAADASLAFTVRKDRDGDGVVVVPAGTAAETMPLGRGHPVGFETATEIVASEDWNKLSVAVPTRAEIHALGPGGTMLRLAGVHTGLNTGSPLFIVFNGNGSLSSPATTHFRLVDRVKVDKEDGQTTVIWKSGLALPQGVKPTTRYTVLGAAVPTTLLGDRSKPWNDMPAAVKRHLGTPVGGVFRGSGSGPDWRPSADGLPPQPVLALATGAEGTIFAGTGAGLFRYQDDAFAWVETGAGLAKRGVHALTVGPAGRLYAGGERSRVFRSTDDGMSWEALGTRSLRQPGLLAGLEKRRPLPDTVVRALAVHQDPTTGEAVVVAGTDKGVLYLKDVGGDWRPGSKGLPGYASRTGLANAVVAAVAVDDASGRIFAATDKGIFVASRIGGSWRSSAIVEPPGVGPREWVKRLLALLKRLWSAVADWLRKVARKVLSPLRRLFAPVLRLLRKLFGRGSKGNADHKTKKKPDTTSLQGASLLLLLAADGDGDRVLAGTQDGVYASDDAGATWYRSSDGLAPAATEAAPAPSSVLALAVKRAEQGDTVYAGSDRGVWVSTDRGRSWSAANGARRKMFTIEAERPGEPADWAAAFEMHGITLSDRTPFSGSLADGGLVMTDKAAGKHYAIEGTAAKASVYLEADLKVDRVEALAIGLDGVLHAATPYAGFVEADWPGSTVMAASLDLSRKIPREITGGWIGLQAGKEPSRTSALPIRSGSTVAADRFGLSGSVTRIRTAAPDHPLAFERRDTSVFLSGRALPVFERHVSMLTPVKGAKIRLNGAIGGLHRDQRMSLTGKRIGARVVAIPGGVYRIDGDEAKRVGHAGSSVDSLAVDANGVIVAGTDRGLVTISGAPSVALPTDRQEFSAVGITSGDGALHVGTNAGVLTSLRWSADRADWSDASLADLRIKAMATDAADDLVVGTSSGVYRRTADGWRPVGLVGDRVRALAIGDDGAILAGTEAGVVRLHDGASEPLGLEHHGVHALAIDGRGALLAGTHWGLFRRGRTDGWAELGLNEYRISALLVAADGAIYAGTKGHGLFVSRDRGRTWRRIMTGVANDIRAIVVDGDDGILVGTGDRVILAGDEPGAFTEVRQALRFTIERSFGQELDDRTVSGKLRAQFERHAVRLSDRCTVSVLTRSSLWVVANGPGKALAIRDDGADLTVFDSWLFEVMEAPGPVAPSVKEWSLRTPQGLTGHLDASTTDVVYDHAGEDFAPVAEIVEVADAAPAGSDDAVTVIQLKSALDNVYDGGTVAINGNVAPATAGGTVEEEVLGSGDASKPNQVFVLKKPPLSYVHAPTDTGIASTLSVAVKAGPARQLPNELGELAAAGVAPVPWRQVDSLAYQTDTDRAFVVRTDDKGRTTVTFGDGINGARLPSGEENVIARYRSGGGLAGNVAAGAVRTLGNRPAAVRTATNPLAASGGVDPETLDAARVMAPLSTRPLQRVVSLSDYEDFARLYPGIGRAAAKELWDGKAWLIHITIGAADGGSVARDSDLHRGLGDSIRRHRASVRKMRLDGYRLITFDVGAAVTIDKGADPQDMRRALTDHLAGMFSAANRRFAQDVAASEIVVALQRHPGVVAVDLNGFHLTGSGKGTRPLLRALEARWDPHRDVVVPAQVLAINAADDGIALTVEAVS